MSDINISELSPDRIALLVFLVYLAVINMYSIVITVRDKALSKRDGARRVPEKTLFIASALGGSLGMYITMKVIRHKTKHKRFMIGIPVIMTCQALICALTVWMYFAVKQ